jgi:hypothetical protein
MTRRQQDGSPTSTRAAAPQRAGKSVARLTLPGVDETALVSPLPQEAQQVLHDTSWVVSYHQLVSMHACACSKLQRQAALTFTHASWSFSSSSSLCLTLYLSRDPRTDSDWQQVVCTSAMNVAHDGWCMQILSALQLACLLHRMFGRLKDAARTVGD